MFATTQSSATVAGATTTPLNSVPTVAAPFKIAFDALNTNGHYEEVTVTSKTVTNINHSETAFSHSTDEEVRLVVTAGEMDELWSSQAQNSGAMNSKIVPSVSSNNLTVELKTLDGLTPTALNPISTYIAGDFKTITSDISLTVNAGTNTFDSGSILLSGNEIDYFVCLVWDTVGNTLRLGITRYPGGSVYNDYSSTATNEKYIAISGGTPAATDEVKIIGRFAAINSGTASYNWSIPTFTSKNLINKPIYETRVMGVNLTASTVTGVSSVDTTNSLVTYLLSRNVCHSYIRLYGTSNSTTFAFKQPFKQDTTTQKRLSVQMRAIDGGGSATNGMALSDSGTFTFYRDAIGNLWTASGTKINDGFNTTYFI